MTYGEKLVGLTFNPSGDQNVDRVKRLFAEIIDICSGLQENAPPMSDSKQLFTIAASHALTAQMWAVKTITWKD